MDSFTIILIVLIGIGSLAGVFLTVKKLLNTENNKNEIIKSQKTDIIELKNELSDSNKKLNKKQTLLEEKSDSIESLSQKVLDFSENIDKNTQEIKILSNKISNVTSQTNKVTKIIENEQRQKGIIKLKRPNSSTFDSNFGGNTITINPDTSKTGINVSQNLLSSGLNVTLKFDSEYVYVSTVLNDIQGNRIIELQDGEWAINKSKNFSINYDDSAIEIIDNKGLVVFQVVLKNNTFTFKGIYYKNEHALIYSDEGIMFLKYNSKDFKEEFYKYTRRIDRIFRHVGTGYLGERIFLSKKGIDEKDKKRKVRQEIEKNRKYSDSYDNEIEFIVLMQKTKEIMLKIDLLFEENKNMNESYYTNIYKDSLKIETCKIRNSLLKAILIKKDIDRELEIDDLYKNPKSNTDLKSIKGDLNKLLKEWTFLYN